MAKTITRSLMATIIAVFVMAFAQLAAYATLVELRDDTDMEGNGEYALIYYKVDIIVNEDNTFDITEDIIANFVVERRGITREIPLRNEVVRLDGTRAVNRAKVSDVWVAGAEASMRTEDNYQIIRIGNSDVTVTGSKAYRIKYKYDIGRDTGKGYDEFYFNIIGAEWDTTISTISFNITMPKEFDASKVGFSHGERGAVNSSKVAFAVNGNTISGTYDGVLRPWEALTIRVELPEGYFVRAGLNMDVVTILSFAIPIAALLIMFVMWLVIGRDDKVFETVEFYPPNGYNSVDVAFAYKGGTSEEDIMTLLIYLANKGYLRIEETEEKTMVAPQSNYKFVKLKDYQGHDRHEEDFLKGLFATGDEVTESDLQNKFHTTLLKIAESYNKKENKEKLFYRNSTNKNVVGLLLAAAILIVNMIRPAMDINNILVALVVTLFPIIGVWVFVSALFRGPGVVIVNGVPKEETRFGSIMVGLLFLAVFTGIGLALMIFFWGMGDASYYTAYAIGAFSIYGVFFFLEHMPKRTPLGNQILGRVKGFRNFLETAEKLRLEALVEQDPEYFYNILPYTYVLDVSDKWIDKFAGIALRAPDWYRSNADFYPTSFGVFMSSTLSSAALASMPPLSSSSGSGGGFSGGGSSGGGSGGGGGSSW